MKKTIRTALLLAILCSAAYFCALRLFPVEYADLIKKYSDAYSLDPYTVTALIKTESNFNEGAASSADAKGLMQLTDATASFCALKTGVTNYDVYDPETNIMFGTWYLSWLYARYGGEKCALAAYNAGFGYVDAWLSDRNYSSDGVTLDVIPFAETANHAERVGWYATVYRFLYPHIFE